MTSPLDAMLCFYIMFAERFHSGGRFAELPEAPFRHTCDRVLTNDDYYSVDEVLETAFRDPPD